MTRFSAQVTGAIALVAFLAQTAAPAAAAPLQTPHPTNIVWNLSATDIQTSCTAEIARARSAIAAIVALRAKRTFQNTVAPLEDAAANLNDRTVAQTFLSSVATSKPVRDASNDCNNAESDFFTKFSADPKLYAAVAASSRSKTAKSVYDRALTSQWLDSLKRSGAGLGPAQRSEFVSLSSQLAKLQNQFQQNLGNDKTSITIAPDQIGGLPADFVAANLKKDGSGNYVVPVNESTASFLTNDSNEAARKAFSIAYSTRQAASNTKLLEQAIGIRDRLAHLIGYQTWAAFQLSDRLAKTPSRVFSFLNALDSALLPKAREELATLRALKVKETGDANAVVQPWDFSFYDNMLNKTQYAVDNNAIRQYFPVQHTVDAVLGLYHTLLGIDFRQVANPNVWNADVLEYNVFDSKSGRFIGSTYFDLFPRDGKYDHFANFPILPVRRVGTSTRPPIAVIVGNWPKPAAGYPALLSHDDVVTFFHEFGHNLAALLATAPYETLSGGFVQDFVEAPSQMLENFMWQPSILKQVSSKATTGAPLPDELIDSMVKARYVDNAYKTTSQLRYALVDMRYHTGGPHVDTDALWASVTHDTMALDAVPGTHPQASFGHLMGGYDAGYYGYLFSKVYAQDMFTAFQRGGLENPAVGMRYRVDILQPAKTYDPDTEVKRFLGRPVSPNAFYADFGIAPPGSTPK